MFDLFGTLLSYCNSGTAQGFQRSHELLLEAGATVSYDEFLDEWDATFCEFESGAQKTHDEFTMDQVCSAFTKRTVGDAADDGLVQRFRRTYLEEWTRCVDLVPGVADMIIDLSDRYTLTVITNTHDGAYARSQIDRIGVTDRFVSIVTSVEHGKRKPSAEIFDYALQVSGAAAESTLFVGDSLEADYTGATGAGMMAVLIDPERKHDIPASDRIDTITELPAWLEEAI